MGGIDDSHGSSLDFIVADALEPEYVSADFALVTISTGVDVACRVATLGHEDVHGPAEHFATSIPTLIKPAPDSSKIGWRSTFLFSDGAFQFAYAEHSFERGIYFKADHCRAVVDDGNCRGIELDRFHVRRCSLEKCRRN